MLLGFIMRATGAGCEPRVLASPVRPRPITYFVHVGAVLLNVVGVFNEFLLHIFIELLRFIAIKVGAFNDVHHKVEAVKLILNRHIKGGSNGAFFLIAPNVNALVGTAVNNTVNQPWVAVKGEDNWLIHGK